MTVKEDKPVKEPLFDRDIVLGLCMFAHWRMKKKTSFQRKQALRYRLACEELDTYLNASDATTMDIILLELSSLFQETDAVGTLSQSVNNFLQSKMGPELCDSIRNISADLKPMVIAVRRSVIV